jgi:hypothetical protein
LTPPGTPTRPICAGTQLLLASSLAELQTATGQQLSSAERAVSIAEQQLKAQQDAAQTARGSVTRSLTLPAPQPPANLALPRLS